MCGKCGNILAQCYCAAAKEPIEALGDYMLARTQLCQLEEREDECRCDAYEFHTCDLCREYRDINGHARSLMEQWGDSWAVRLWSIREESRLPQYAEVEDCQEPDPDPGGRGMSKHELKTRFGL